MDQLNFKLTEEQANVIVKCLAEQPYKAVHETLHAIQIQYSEQKKPIDEKPDPDLA